MPRPCKLTFDLLTLKVVSESCVTWATSVPILVFLGLSIPDLSPMYATDRQTSSDVRRASSLNAPGPRGGSIITIYSGSAALAEVCTGSAEGHSSFNVYKYKTDLAAGDVIVRWSACPILRLARNYAEMGHRKWVGNSIPYWRRGGVVMLYMFADNDTTMCILWVR